MKQATAGASGAAGQALVETAIITVLLTIVVFAAVQFVMVALLWLRAGEAAYTGARCAIVARGGSGAGTGSSSPSDTARTAVTAVLGPRNASTVTLYDKNPLGSAGRDHSGTELRTFSVHVYYLQRLMFSSLLQPVFAGGVRVAGIPYLDVSRRNGAPSGAVHARLVRSPDRRFYDRAWPGARRFDE